MNMYGIPAFLLFALSIPVMMHYRILPIEGTPYWLFGLIFMFLIGKCFIDLFPLFLRQYNRQISIILLIVIVTSVLGGATWTAIADRHRIAPVWGAHDIVLQQEAAMRYLVSGKNPYKETYFGTPVEMFRYDELGEAAVNPALYHYVMPPWYLLGHFPVYFVANKTIGYFDTRMVSLLALAGISILLWKLIHNRFFAEIAVIVTALSPATVDYFIEGRSDFFALFWLLLALFLLNKKRYILSSFMMALAILSKQTMWFAFPLYIVYMFRILSPLGNLSEHWVKHIRKSFIDLIYEKTNRNIVILCALTFIGVVAVLTIPFLLWDGQAFMQSVVLYLSQGGEKGYPISGYGFSMVLYSLGMFTSLREYYPFTLWQLLVGLPVLGIVSYYLFKYSKLSVWFLGYGVFLSVIWYFSRYFNNSHIAFLSSVFVIGILLHYDEQINRNKEVTKGE